MISSPLFTYIVKIKCEMLNRWSEYSQNDDWMGHIISGLYTHTNVLAHTHRGIYTYTVATRE